MPKKKKLQNVEMVEELDVKEYVEPETVREVVDTTLEESKVVAVEKSELIYATGPIKTSPFTATPNCEIVSACV